RLRHVVVDLVALLLRQRAAGDAEVVDFAAVVEMLGRLYLEAPGIVLGHLVLRAALDDVLGLVGEQEFRGGRRRGRAAAHALALVARHAQAAVERAPPGARADRLEARHLLGRHELAALVAGGDEGELLVEGPQLRLEGGPQLRHFAPRSDRLET